MPSCSLSALRSALRRSLCCHQSRLASSVSPLTVFTRVSKSPAARRCEHHLRHASCKKHLHRREILRPIRQRVHKPRNLRFTSAQSSTVGRFNPAENATAGRCSSRFVDPPNAACSTIAFLIAASVSTSRTPIFNWCIRISARAERFAASSHIGWPEGASAVCGSASPNASPTTCAVAAVPRNWHPPPGLAQARHPTSAAYSSVICFCANRAPMVCTLPASSPDGGQQRHAPGNQNRRARPSRSQRHHHRRQALVARRDAQHALARGQRPHQPRSTIAASLRNGSESIIPVVPCVRPSQGSVHAPANGTARSAFNSRAASATSRPTSQCPV